MKRFILALVMVAALMVPAAASAMTTGQVTAYVKQTYTRQIRAKASLAGYTFVGDTMKCANIGGQHWTCYATLTLFISGIHIKSGIFISVGPGGAWKTVGSATTLRQW